MYSNKEDFTNESNKEHFGMQPTKDVCHYSCSKLKITNILMICVIIILLYMITKKW